MKILIMDFETPPGMRNDPREIRGWWLGARTVYQNPRAGVMFADRLSSHLAPLPFVNLFSRLELRYYFARKRQMLKDAYPQLNGEEVGELLMKTPGLEFARELGADKALTGRIVESRLSENRTFHWWNSRAEVDCELTDVLTGEVQWRGRYRLRKRFASQSSVQEALARRVAADLKERYFLPLAQ